MKLVNYSDKYKNILDEIVRGESKSDFIHQIEERLLSSKDAKELELNKAYLVSVDDNIVGYVYLSAMPKDYIYMEYLILKQYRKQGLGKYIINEVTDLVFNKYDNMKEIRLNIDRSNLASMSLAESLDFYDDGDYSREKIDFIKNNPYYVDRRKKR